ncbi:uncharacterized protein LAESUDRAFT_601562, partial [Laetiporus sulphureus 93-53]
LRREFRELEILDEIGQLRLRNELPTSVVGCTRSSLVRSFQSTFGLRYVPPTVPAALDWHNSPVGSLMPPLEPASWRLIEKEHCAQPTSARRRKSTGTVLTTAGPASTHGNKRRTEGDDALSSASKRGRPNSTLPSVGCSANAASSYVATGFKWDEQNWSCAYDAMLSIL